MAVKQKNKLDPQKMYIMHRQVLGGFVIDKEYREVKDIDEATKEIALLISTCPKEDTKTHLWNIVIFRNGQWINWKEGL